MAKGDQTTSPAKIRAFLRRREFLKATGVGVGASMTGVGTAAANSSVPYATGPTPMSWAGVPLDPTGLREAMPPTDPDIQGEGGSSEVEEIARMTPQGSSQSGGPSGSPLVARGGENIRITSSFEGLGTRDVVRGVDFDDNGNVEENEIFFLVPSDAQLGVSHSHVIEVINSEVGIFDKDGNRQHHFRLEDWFSNVLSLAPDDEPAAQAENILVFDPRVRYDSDAGRFCIACVEFNFPDTRPDDTVSDDEDDEPDLVPDSNDSTGAYLLSVSETGNPMDPWTNYRIPPLQGDPPRPVQGANPTPGLVDFPQLGFSSSAVYLTQNFFEGTFSTGFRFTGATMEILDKADLLSGDAVDTLHFTGLQNPGGDLAFTVQPTKGADHLMNARFFQGQTLTVWSVSNPTDGETIEVSNDALRVKPYHNPEPAKQPDTEDKIDTGDSRIVDALGYDGSSGHLWAAHTINDGSARWYEVDPTGPSVVQSNTFKREGLPTFYPVVDTDGDSAIMVYNVCGPKDSADDKDFARIEVAGRTSGFHDGKLEDFAIVREGESAYDLATDGVDRTSQVMRWGDYNGIQIDPDGNGYWVISQYANDPETELTYGTQIANVDFGD